MKMFALFFKKTIVALLLFCFAMTLLMVRANDVFAVRNEQMVLDAYSTSLANSVTAEPNFLMAIHFNPAGLSMLGEGGFFAQGLSFARISRRGTFTEDPDYPGLMNGQWSPTNSNIYDDENNPWPNDRDKQVAADLASDHGGPDPVAGRSGTNSGTMMFVPIPAIGELKLPIAFSSNQGAARRQPGSRWTFGWGIYAPFGGGIVHDDDNDPHRFGIKHAYHQHFIYSAPSVAYEFSPQLAVGLSIGIAQRSFGLMAYGRSPKELTALSRVIGDATQDLNIPVISDETYPGPFYGGGLGPYEHALTVDITMRDDFCPTFNLGMLWRPKPWFSFGACYRSQSTAEMSGKYRFTYSEQFRRVVDWSGKTRMTVQGAAMLDNPTVSVPYQSGTATATMKLPRIVAFGIKIQPVEKLKILLNLNWANWSIAKTTRIHFDQRIQPLRLAKTSGWTWGSEDYVVEDHMVDTWNPSLGLEYQLTDKLALRCGVEDRPASARKSYYGMSTMYLDSRIYGLGLGIKLPKGKTIDIAFGHVWTEDVYIPNNGSTNLNSTDMTKGGSFAGLNYKHEMYVDIFAITIRIPLDARKKQLSGVARKIKGLFNKLNPFTYIK